jgi:hypothetical protein
LRRLLATPVITSQRLSGRAGGMNHSNLSCSFHHELSITVDNADRRLDYGPRMLGRWVLINTAHHEAPRMNTGVHERDALDEHADTLIRARKTQSSADLHTGFLH